MPTDIMAKVFEHRVHRLQCRTGIGVKRAPLSISGLPVMMEAYSQRHVRVVINLALTILSSVLSSDIVGPWGRVMPSPYLALPDVETMRASCNL